MKEQIYVVDDEVHIQELIKYNLEANGYRVQTFYTGESLLEATRSEVPGLYIIDIMLPGMDGLEVCRNLRQNSHTKNIPIIMLTAKSEEIDKVLGLELGADDYITKPFGIRELAARIKALLRRSANISALQDTEIIKHGNISMDLDRHEVFKNGALVNMTFKEFELLRLLLANKGKVFSRDMLLEKVWGYDYLGETRTIDVHIRYLREKIEDDPNNPVYIETIRGVGYRFNDKQDG